MIQLLLIAKAPVPGLVKTRLCPPCTPVEAAAIAAAALSDTLAAASTLSAERRTLVVDGDYPAPDGWHAVAQRGDGLGVRLANCFADTALADIASLLIGMDTPQVNEALLASVESGLAEADAVVAPAVDGGWWALALQDPADAVVLADVAMSTPDTGQATVTALRERGLRVAVGPMLRDVDTADDAREVAAGCRHGAFAEAVRRHLPARTAPRCSRTETHATTIAGLAS